MGLAAMVEAVAAESAAERGALLQSACVEKLEAPPQDAHSFVLRLPNAPAEPPTPRTFPAMALEGAMLAEDQDGAWKQWAVTGNNAGAMVLDAQQLLRYVQMGDNGLHEVCWLNAALAAIVACKPMRDGLLALHATSAQCKGGGSSVGGFLSTFLDLLRTVTQPVKRTRPSQRSAAVWSAAGCMIAKLSTRAAVAAVASGTSDARSGHADAQEVLQTLLQAASTAGEEHGVGSTFTLVCNRSSDDDLQMELFQGWSGDHDSLSVAAPAVQTTHAMAFLHLQEKHLDALQLAERPSEEEAPQQVEPVLGVDPSAAQGVHKQASGKFVHAFSGRSLYDAWVEHATAALQSATGLEVDCGDGGVMFHTPSCFLCTTTTAPQGVLEGDDSHSVAWPVQVFLGPPQSPLTVAVPQRYVLQSAVVMEEVPGRARHYFAVVRVVQENGRRMWVQVDAGHAVLCSQVVHEGVIVSGSSRHYTHGGAAEGLPDDATVLHTEGSAAHTIVCAVYQTSQ